MNASNTQSTFDADGGALLSTSHQTPTALSLRRRTAVGWLRVLGAFSMSVFICRGSARAAEAPATLFGFEYVGRSPNPRGGVVEFLISAARRRKSDGGGWAIRELVSELSGPGGRTLVRRVSCEGRLSDSLDIQNLRWEESSSEGVRKEISVNRLGDRLVVGSGTSPVVELASVEPAVATIAGLVLIASISAPSDGIANLRTLSLPECKLSRAPMEWGRTQLMGTNQDVFIIPGDRIDIVSDAGGVTEIRMRSIGWTLRPDALRSVPRVPPLPDAEYHPSSPVEALAGVEFFGGQGDRARIRVLVDAKQVMKATNRRGLVQFQLEDEVLEALVSSYSGFDESSPELAWVDAVSAAIHGRRRLSGAFVDLGSGLLMQAELVGGKWRVVDILWREESVLESSIPAWSAVAVVQRMVIAQSLVEWKLYEGCIDWPALASRYPTEKLEDVRASSRDAFQRESATIERTRASIASLANRVQLGSKVVTINEWRFRITVSLGQAPFVLEVEQRSDGWIVVGY